MSKEVLALDVDEVVFPLVSHYLVQHNENYGTAFSADDLTTYRLEDVLSLPVDEMIKRIYEFHDADHTHIDPLENTQEGINRLRERFDINIVTARHSRFYHQTEKWLRDKIGDFFGSIHMIGYGPVVEKPITKSEVCLSIGAIALVDDNLEHLTDLPKYGKEGVLFGDYRWNQADSLPPGITRCLDMIKVAEHFGV
jgi:5'(3')-deoxyribonucleotidase